MSALNDFLSLAKGISNVALAVAPDYPNIKDCDPFEQLYAIKASYEGTNLANQDLHKLIGILREKLGMTAEEVAELWEKEGPND